MTGYLPYFGDMDGVPRTMLYAYPPPTKNYGLQLVKPGTGTGTGTGADTNGTAAGTGAGFGSGSGSGGGGGGYKGAGNSSGPGGSSSNSNRRSGSVTRSLAGIGSSRVKDTFARNFGQFGEHAMAMGNSNGGGSSYRPVCSSVFDNPLRLPDTGALTSYDLPAGKY